MDQRSDGRSVEHRVVLPVGAAGWPTWLLGAALIGISLAAAGVLTAQHLMGIQLPGCGPASACAQLASGRWGSVAGWPLAYIGAAYFSALLAAWVISGVHHSLSGVMRTIFYSGGLVSVFLMGVMVVDRQFCWYCLACQLGYLGFCGVVFVRSAQNPVAKARPELAGLIAFGAVTLTLIAIQSKFQDVAQAAAEKQFVESLGRIGATIENQRQPVPRPAAGVPFAGRYPSGPSQAAIRLVLFTDYQCKDCHKIEKELQGLLMGRTDVAVSFKHFPYCKDCNPHIRMVFHENACNAARAAEAAGILAGTQGFATMHAWLLDHHGKFTERELKDALPSLGFPDIPQFLRLMHSEEALAPIQRDIEEGIALGLNETPMIFVNGQELQGWNAPQAIARMLEVVTRLAPAPQTADVDQPPAGVDRLVDVWRAGPPYKIQAARAPRWTLGPADAKVRAVLLMCHQNEYSKDTSEIVQQAMRPLDDVRIEYWHFPLSKAHNAKLAKLPKDPYPLSYSMAQAAEAAGMVGGNEAFWKMHRWLLEHRTDFTVEAAADQAAVWGLDRAQFESALNSPAVASAIEADIQAGIAAGFTWAPGIYLQQRRVKSSGVPSVELLQRVFQEAGAK